MATLADLMRARAVEFNSVEAVMEREGALLFEAVKAAADAGHFSLEFELPCETSSAACQEMMSEIVRRGFSVSLAFGRIIKISW